jgi:hypothetical protein
MNRTRTKNVVIAAILWRFCIIIPLFMPIKVIIGPYNTATLASQADPLGTFIFPLDRLPTWRWAAQSVFLISWGPSWGRGPCPMLFFRPLYGVRLPANIPTVSCETSLSSGLSARSSTPPCEVLVVIFMGTGIQNSGEILAWTFFGTMAHHMIDLAIAYVI